LENLNKKEEGMMYVNVNNGLGKPFWKKIRIKDVSLKNAIKVVKFAAPIAVGFIPVGGGVASKLLNSKAGRLVSKISKSKIAKKAIKLSKTQAGKLVVNQAKNIARPKIEAIQAMSAATFAKTDMQTAQASLPYANEDQSEDTEPVGNLTPVTQRSITAKEEITTGVPEPKKDNTMLYVGGAVALAGFAFFATKKSK
jgi:hypothetical protein